MKKHFPSILVLSACVLMALPSHAQTTRQRLQPAEGGSQIVNLSKAPAATETAFGRGLVERLKATGTPLPMDEAKLLRMKPGTRHFVRPVAPGEKPLAFSGMLQYNQHGERMLLDYGFYRFSQQNGFVRETMAPVDWDLNGRGAYYNHKLHGTSSLPLPYLGSNNWVYCEWDTDTWEPTGNHGTRSAQQTLIVKAADWDPTTGICYGWKDEGTSGQSFMRIDYETQSREIISSSDSLCVMLAINSQGEMYGVTENGSFCRVDKATGNLTYIGTLDFNFYAIFESMTFDRTTDRLYMAATEVDEEAEEMMGRLCEVDVTTGKTTLIAYLPEAEEYTCLHVLDEPDGDAPAALTDMLVNFASEGTAGIVNFTLPTTTIDGQELTGNISYRITVNDNEEKAVTGEGAAGQWKAAVLYPEGTGRQKVVVQLTANGKTGKRNWAKAWIGADTPKPSNVVFTRDEATGLNTLTWNASQGKMGGYTDPAAQTFNVVRYPGAVKVATGISGTQFSETITDADYDGYYYRVTALQDDTECETTASNVVRYGHARMVPFVDDFEDADAGSAYTILDTDGDGLTWDFAHFDSTTGRLRHDFSRGGQIDDWCLTPPLHLMEGVAYQIKFDAFGVSPAYRQRLAVACGQGTDPLQYDLLIPVTEVSTSLQQGMEMTGEIKVKQTGDYYFGFHDLSDEWQNSLFIDNLQITAGMLLITPDSVKNLRLTPADDGDLIVTIDFDAPTVANDGNPLESLTAIDIRRGQNGDLVTTIKDAEPGKHYTIVDEDAVNGEVLYSVTAFNEAGAGLTTQATVYVGTDAPDAPISVTLADQLDGTAILSWQAPTKGQHNGYVDPDELTYNVWGVVDNELRQVKSNISDMNYQVTGIAQTGQQGQVIYGVNALNELGESNIALAAPLIYGAPYTLPFMENFLTAGLKGIWATRSNTQDVSWKMYTGMSSDGDDCLTAVESEKAGAWAVLTSGKVSLEGADTPKLVFTAFGDPGTANRLKVAIQKNGEAKADTLLTVDYATMQVEDFITYAIDLSAYKDAKYITASFVAELNDPKLRLVAIDDVNFRNVVACNMTAYADVQRRTTAGQPARISVTTHNVGEQTANDYTVSIYVNGQQVKTFEQNEAVEPFGRQRFDFTYATKATDPEQTLVWATVDYAADLDLNDNTTEQLPLVVVPSQLEAVASLVATNADGKSTLVWTPVSGRNEVTESFEGYDSFQSTFGQWGNYDRDNCATAGINGLWWPGAGQPQAFLTFNFREAGVTEAQMRQYPQFEANSGTQFLACFKANNAPGNKNNDWLISPELSGEEQTIRIYAESLAGVWNETFEVRYSTTGNQVTDFNADQVVDEYEAPKNYFGRFAATLPAGAKYFAIHCNSQNGGIFMLDDISYEGRPLTLKGYNIYCDNQLVGTADAEATSFEHPTGTFASGLHTYHVTAVYAEGESPLSNAAPVAVISGIDDVQRSTSNVQRFYNLNGQQLKNAQKGVLIHNGSKKLVK